MQACQRITRKSASNLALAFVLLPKPKREGMSALYAFCRQVDDIADDEGAPAEERRALLSAWREDVRQACASQQAPQFPVNQELQPVIARYGLSFDYFDELIRGVEMDLDTKRYRDYEGLELYCYRVASVVGLLSIQIFGYQDRACRDYAIYLGKALQFTNILRDVHTDADRGRIYLPLNELERFGVKEEEILRGRYSDRYRALAASVTQRARQFYQLARQTLPPAERSSMAAAELMGAVYWRLLNKLERRPFATLEGRPTKVGKGHKLLLILRMWLDLTLGGPVTRYGMP